MSRHHDPTQAPPSAAPPVPPSLASPRAIRSPHPAQSARPGLLFGLHPVAAAWINPERRVHRLLATEAALAGLATAIEQAKAAKIERPAPTWSSEPISTACFLPEPSTRVWCSTPPPCPRSIWAISSARDR